MAEQLKPISIGIVVSIAFGIALLLGMPNLFGDPSGIMSELLTIYLLTVLPVLPRLFLGVLAGAGVSKLIKS